MKRKISSYPFLILLIHALTLSAWAQAERLTKPIDLLAGAKWVCSTDGGKTYSPAPVTIKARKTTHVIARTEFNVADPSQFIVLELTPNLPTRSRSNLKFFLNGKGITPPMEGMNYKTYPAIDAKMLKKGINTLLGKITLKGRKKDYQLDIKMQLIGLTARDLKIQTGPILGAFGERFFTVTCRTNMPAEVILWRPSAEARTLNPQIWKSNRGMIHRFCIKTDPPVASLDKRKITAIYRIAACLGNFKTRPINFRATLSLKPDELRFAALGDSRTNVEDWAKVADAILEEKPDLIVFSGDMVSYGLNDWQWDEQFFAPAKKLLATIPFYPIIGNHEHNAPVYPELFYTPSKDGKSKNWSQEINGVLFIGIDGAQDFSKDSKNYRWLEKTLEKSKAKFIFFFNHYPAYSSSYHGRLDEKTNQPREKTVRQARDVLVPLLVKYRITAYICGHDHVYERSELPNGLTHIISGGAGAPRYKKTEEAKKQNPYSKVFHATLHYCIFEIKADTCSMKAITPTGEVIDSRTWKARKTIAE